MFEMNEEQKRLFDDLTRLQQEICLNSISGMSDIDCYRNSCGKATTESSMRATVCEILANPNVVAFMDSMKACRVNDAIMSKQRMMELQTAIADMTMMDLEDLTPQKLSELKDGMKVKLQAMKQLSELAGYDAPKEVKIDKRETLTPWDDMTFGEE